MEMTRLGPDGPLVSRVGMGGCPLGGHGWGRVDDDESIAAVRRALDRGVTFFDTADVYGLGHSEEILAEALGPRHRDVVVATKFGVFKDAQGRTVKDTSPAHLRRALEASLRRLKLDRIPLYYVHWPDGVTPIEETMIELLRQRNAGKIGGIGLSNFPAELVERALAVGPVQVVQVQLSLLDRTPIAELLQIVEQTGIALVTWGSLAQGLLTGKYDIDAQFKLDDRRRRYENFLGEKFRRNLAVVDCLKLVANRLGRTPAQVALRWVLDYPGIAVALFGAKRPAQIDDNVGALDWRLPLADFKELARGANAACLRRCFKTLS